MTTKTSKATVATPTDRQIIIERVFNAPRERVWKALTDPALVPERWGRGNRLVIERMEPRRGGHWRLVDTFLQMKKLDIAALERAYSSR